MEEHVPLVGQPSDRFLGHIVPPAKDSIVFDVKYNWIMAKQPSNFTSNPAKDVKNGYDGDLEAVGGDSTASNTGHKGGIIHHLKLKTQYQLGHHHLQFAY